MNWKFILIFLIVFTFSFYILNRDVSSEKINQVCFDKHCFKVELALTQEQRAEGLMFRDELSFNEGMLFVFPEENIYGFWMKNTFIELDIIWINENKEIVFIKNNATPCNSECFSIVPDEKAKYVLELNSTVTEGINLSKGDFLIFKS